jgi:hypothetical protein
MHFFVELLSSNVHKMNQEITLVEKKIVLYRSKPSNKVILILDEIHKLYTGKFVSSLYAFKIMMI